MHAADSKKQQPREETKMEKETVLKVENMVTTFKIDKKEYEVLRDISFEIQENETLCMVGESGCGKSVTTLSVMGLLAANGKVRKGSIQLCGKELTTMSEKQLNAVRGKEMGMIFQEPMTSLNPLLTIGFQMSEGLIRHHGMSKKEAWEESIRCLERVGIAAAPERMKQYPFQLSGGLRQRVMIAMVMAMKPKLLIADEPTTALDVTIQKQVLILLNKLKKEMNTGVLFITHDLGVVAEIADRVIVLYSGTKVEEGSVKQIFENTMHPYTIGLMQAVPNVDKDDFEIKSIPGTFPSITEDIGGCRFHPRCPYATQRCRTEVPKPIEYEKGHFVACHKTQEEHQ